MNFDQIHRRAPGVSDAEFDAIGELIVHAAVPGERAAWVRRCRQRYAATERARQVQARASR